MLCNFFEVFARFSKFSEVFGPVRMRSDASRGVRMRSDEFGAFRKFWSEQCDFCISGRDFDRLDLFLTFASATGVKNNVSESIRPGGGGVGDAFFG